MESPYGPAPTIAVPTVFAIMPLPPARDDANETHCLRNRAPDVQIFGEAASSTASCRSFKIRACPTRTPSIVVGQVKTRKFRSQPTAHAPSWTIRNIASQLGAAENLHNP